MNINDLRSFPDDTPADSVLHAEPAPCPRCGSESQRVTVTLFGKPMSFTSMCAGCSETAKRQASEQEALEREHRIQARWQSLCPPMYRQTDVSRLPVELLARVMAWEFGPKGLLIQGPTGQSKTRVAWQLMRRLLDEGRTIIAYDEITFADECARYYGNGDGSEWCDALCTVDVLFLDDLGKSKLTERVESTLWGIVERRIAYLKPLVITSNFRGSAFAARMSDNRGESFVRRLREFCELVKA